MLATHMRLINPKHLAILCCLLLSVGCANLNSHDNEIKGVAASWFSVPLDKWLLEDNPQSLKLVALKACISDECNEKAFIALFTAPPEKPIKKIDLLKSLTKAKKNKPPYSVTIETIKNNDHAITLLGYAKHTNLKTLAGAGLYAAIFQIPSLKVQSLKEQLYILVVSPHRDTTLSIAQQSAKAYIYNQKIEEDKF